MVNYPSDWEVDKIKNLVRVIPPSLKIKTQNYLMGGRYPIIDQGQNFISGYTNENSVFAQNEYVIFGEHTCIIKYVDFAFAQGADGIKVLIVNNNYVIPKYLYYCMSNIKMDTSYSRHWLKMKMQEIPLPPLAEQRAIADTLSTFDTHIKNISALIEKKKAVRDGALDDLMSGRTRLKGFSSEWEVKKLSDIGTSYSGLTGKTKLDFEFGNGKFITFLNILNNVKVDISILGKVHIRYKEKQNAVKVGDLFFNTSSETPEEVGMCAALLDNPGVCYLNSFCFGFRLKCDDVSPLFMSYYFNSSVGREFMRKHAQGSTRYNLSKQNFLAQSIPLPPLAEQQAIADTLTVLDNEISNLEAERDKIIQVRDGAMNDLLTGKVRLIHGK